MWYTPILLSCETMVQRLSMMYIYTANFFRTTMCMTLQFWYIVHANEQQEIEVELTTLLIPLWLPSFTSSLSWPFYSENVSNRNKHVLVHIILTLALTFWGAIIMKFDLSAIQQSYLNLKHSLFVWLKFFICNIKFILTVASWLFPCAWCFCYMVARCHLQHQ